MKTLWTLLIWTGMTLTMQAADKTVEERVKEFGGVVKERLEPYFTAAKVPYPPASITFIGLKQEHVLQVYAAGRDGKYRFIRDYPILAASGNAGPKLCQGDCQVPEGFYKIDLLNPNSKFHLSMRVDYPNESDREHAKLEGRARPLGGDIMIHGNAVSIGCLAMGDRAAEDLFVLAALTGIKHIDVILTPMDFRTQEIPAATPGNPDWLAPLYKKIKSGLEEYDLPSQ
ncbi:MAG TPA: L,D-transpeptidase family protein [Chthoniobacteraceae bacterium]|nr:L,D-transpeptidase family protein [Chthoniobacteraceae bacterium]